MFSDYMSWMIKTLAGISISEKGDLGYSLNPIFISDIDFVDCCYNTSKGKISVNWTREDDEIHLTVDKDNSVPLYYKGELLDQNKYDCII